MTMMKKQLAAAILAVSVAAGVGTGVVADALMTNDPPTAVDQGGETGMTEPDTLTIAPGAVGPVKAGMSKAEAVRTGYFVADVPPAVDGCPVLPLAWKDEYVNTFDVQTLGNGEISSIGIRGRGVVTADGVGVGSTFAQVRETIEDGAPVEAGYGQSGLFDHDGQTGRWIGYLFDPAVDDLKDTDRVTFVEVTKGSQPDLMRDGC
jgi:hypothetical protein